MKKTPFYKSSINHGAKMIKLFGYYLPWEYEIGAESEHIGTRTKASLCDLDYMGEFLIEGHDATKYVQKVFTNDFSEQKRKTIKYTAMCDENGNMVDDGTVWKMDDNKFMFISGDEGDYDWLVGNAVGLDVDISNITLKHTTLALQGPNSKKILNKLVGCNLNRMTYYHFCNTKLDGIDCIVDRLGYTGEFGYEIHFHPRHGEHIWSKIIQAGEAYGIVPCGQKALESLRQEAGYLLVGNDHDKKTNPLEAGIGWTVKFEKGNFNGKAALSKLARTGVSRRLVWFKLREGETAKTGDKILIGNKKIGTVTSGSYSPTSQVGTAMGYVSPQHVIPGLGCVIVIDGFKAKATMSVMPLYDPGDLRTRNL